MIAAIAVTRPDCLFRFLLAILFQGATHIITLFDTAFAVAANVPSVALWFNCRAFPAGFLFCHCTCVSFPAARCGCLLQDRELGISARGHAG